MSRCPSDEAEEQSEHDAQTAALAHEQQLDQEWLELDAALSTVSRALRRAGLRGYAFLVDYTLRRDLGMHKPRSSAGSTKPTQEK